MSSGLILLLACTLVLAIWVLAHVALVVECARDPSLTPRDRWLALLPPVAPWLAWRAGRRRGVIGWACLICLYAILRGILATR